MANGIVPAVVVFSVMVGLALTGAKKKEVLIEPLSLVAELLSKITSFVAKLAPIGVFALIANITGTMSFGELIRLQVYVVVAVSILLVLGLWLLPGLVACATPLRHGEVLRRLRTPLVTAFATGSSLVRAKGEITIALSFFQVLEGEVAKQVPQAKVVRLLSLEEQSRYFETDGKKADAFLDAAEEGAAWTILYPRFTVVVPRPVVQLPVVYAVAPDNPTLLLAMNEWLLIERATGGIEEIYDYWVQGKTGRVQPPRWSLIRDVLHWVD